MQATNKDKACRNHDNSRTSVISVKVTASEKAELQENADDLELSLSEFMRLKSLANIDTSAKYEMQLKEQDEEIKKLKVALSFYNGNIENVPGIALHLTEKQKQWLINLFSNYYKDGKPVEYQIIHYLIEDVFTIHHDLEERTVYDYNLRGHNVLICTRKEVPYNNSYNANELLNAFSEYGITGYRDLNQVKLPHN